MMTNVYVLVHGGSKDGGVWNLVAQQLRQQGCQVYCPSLPEASHSSLKEHIDTVCQVFTQNALSQVRLVGHSYGGVVITGVADLMHDKIEKLIYLDSTVPDSGQSLFTAATAASHESLQKQGVDPKPPFIQPVIYDAKKWSELEKHFILCTESEFLKISKPTYERTLARKIQENWTSHKIKAPHAAMLKATNELIQLLLNIG